MTTSLVKSTEPFADIHTGLDEETDTIFKRHFLVAVRNFALNDDVQDTPSNENDAPSLSRKEYFNTHVLNETNEGVAYFERYLGLFKSKENSFSPRKTTQTRVEADIKEGRIRKIGDLE